MSAVSAEFEMDPQHGPIVRVTVDGTNVAVYLDQETGVVTPPTNRDQYGIEVKGPWWKFRQYIEPPTLPDEVVDLKVLLQCRAEKNRYMKALYNIIDADGNDDSMSSDPAEIARQALEGSEE